MDRPVLGLKGIRTGEEASIALILEGGRHMILAEVSNGRRLTGWQARDRMRGVIDK